MLRTEYLRLYSEAFAEGGNPAAFKVFRTYYGQFVTPELIRRVVRHIGVDDLRKSTDEHLNDIPLRWWEEMSVGADVVAKLAEVGDFLSAATKVCILKEAGRQYLAAPCCAATWRSGTTDQFSIVRQVRQGVPGFVATWHGTDCHKRFATKREAVAWVKEHERRCYGK